MTCMGVQPLAERFRDTCGVDPAYVANFGEEVARGQPVFIMGQLLKCLEPVLRQTAEVAPWQVQPCDISDSSHVGHIWTLGMQTMIGSTVKAE